MSKNDISDADKKAFQEAMQDVTPLDKSNKKNTFKIKPPFKTTIKFKEREIIEDFIKDTMYLSDEFVTTVQPETILSYCSHDINFKRFRQLKRGRIPYETTLDLHGLNTELAKEALIDFIHKAKRKGTRCVLIIHGKGRRHGDFPILKNYINHWLSQIPSILAFHSAQPIDGGAGALYVLLKSHKATHKI